MAVTINADNGVSSGSAGLKQTADSTGVLALQTNGTTAVTIDTSQNVGIGTTTMSNKLTVNGNATLYGTNPYITFSSVYNTTPAYIQSNTSTGELQIYTNGTGSNGFMTFYSGAGAERMRIDSSGFLTVGNSAYTKAPITVQTAPTNSAYGQIAAFSSAASDVGNAGISVTKYDNVSTAGSNIFMRFLINQGATGSGQIASNGASAAAFSSYSDARLKENIVDLPPQLASVCALRPVEFDYIESAGGGHQIGFIAQEMQQVYPDAVCEDVSEEKILTITGWSKTEARLVKAIQELKQIVDAQAAEIAALKTKVGG